MLLSKVMLVMQEIPEDCLTSEKQAAGIRLKTADSLLKAVEDKPQAAERP